MNEIRQNPQNDEASVSAVVLSDSHFSCDPTELNTMDGPSYSLRQRAEAVFAHLAEHFPNSELCIHNGDVVHREHKESYAIYDNLLSEALPKADLYAAVGNHDNASALVDSLNIARRDSLHEKQKVCYRFEKEVHVFLVLDGNALDKNSNPALGKATLEWIQAQVQSLQPEQRVWIFTHYPVFKQVQQLPDRNILADGGELHSLLKDASDQVGAVFSGHLHQEFAVLDHDDIQYVSLSAASTPLRVGDNRAEYDPDGLYGYHDIQFFADGRFSLQRVGVNEK